MTSTPTGTDLELAGEVILRRREERRLLSGHAWVFSNEIERTEGDPPGGSAVAVLRSDGRTVGYGLYNPHSLIAVRIFSRTRRPLDQALLEERIRRAEEMRERLYPGVRAYRLVHGESDGLPGVVIDRYGAAFCLQIYSLGMDQIKDTICDALERIFGPSTVVERNESWLRTLEGLPQTAGVLRGDPPGEVSIRETDLTFILDLLRGHKTGFYYDQRDNRIALRRYAQGCRVLDLYCNEGAFALHLARAGAGEVRGIDASGEALGRARKNAAVNGLEGSCTFEEDDVPRALGGLHATGQQYGLVVLDPPSFTRSRKNVPQARRAYTDVNRGAMRVLFRGGVLATASCSHHITEETFLGCVREAAGSLGRDLLLLEWRSQSPDHPVLPAMPETRYLKLGIFRVD
jgi:23S rRNA (cytosine1962-C5)-methyltransferase